MSCARPNAMEVLPTPAWEQRNILRRSENFKDWNFQNHGKLKIEKAAIMGICFFSYQTCHLRENDGHDFHVLPRQWAPGCSSSSSRGYGWCAATHRCDLEMQTWWDMTSNNTHFGIISKCRMLNIELQNHIPIFCLRTHRPFTAMYEYCMYSSIHTCKIASFALTQHAVHL